MTQSGNQTQIYRLRGSHSNYKTMHQQYAIQQFAWTTNHAIHNVEEIIVKIILFSR